MRRQAAKDAESKLSTYTYGGMDVGGSAIPSSDMGSQMTDHTSVGGWPDFVIVSAGPHQAEAERPSRDGFMARRGGKNSHASMKPRASESHSGISKRPKTAVLEDSDDSEDDRPLVKRGRAHHLSQEDDEAIPLAVEHPESSSDTWIVPDVCSYPFCPEVFCLPLVSSESCINSNSVSSKNIVHYEAAPPDETFTQSSMERRLHSKHESKA